MSRPTRGDSRPHRHSRRWTTCGRSAARGGQPPVRPPNDTAVICAAGDGRGQHGAVTPTLYAAADDGLSTIHSTYYRY